MAPFQTCVRWSRFPTKMAAKLKIDLSQVTDKLYHIMLHRVHLAWSWFELTTLEVIGTDCIGSYKSNYHMIKTTLFYFIYLMKLWLWKHLAP
jgi:hypothetical protein